MPILFDQRAALGGQPAVHAVLIGVSAYPNLPEPGGAATNRSFGMERLESAALSAYRMQEWLCDPKTMLPVPLATVRVMLMPSQREIQQEPQLAGFQAPWVVQDLDKLLNEWREDAKTHRDNVAFFYFAGHGVQRTRDEVVLLLPEYGAPHGGLLASSIDTGNLFYGMVPAPAQDNIARTQLYFVDACRVTPEAFAAFGNLQTHAAFDEPLGGVDDRYAPIFYASLPGASANARRGKQTVFSEALLSALKGAGGEAMEEDVNGNVQWRVSVHSLDRALTSEIQSLNATYGIHQEYAPGGAPRQTTVCRLAGPPLVELSVRLVPPEAAINGSLQLLNDSLAEVDHASPVQPHPWTTNVPAGTYTIQVTFAPGGGAYRSYSRSRPIMPPRVPLEARCM